MVNPKLSQEISLEPEDFVGDSEYMRISCPRPIIIYLKRVRIARNEDTQKTWGGASLSDETAKLG